MIEWVPATGERAAELFAACPDYFQRLHGHGYSQEDVRDFLEGKPPEVAEKHTWMARLEGQIIGAVDFLRDYPEPGTVYVGLLMVREDRQREGLGARLFEQLEILSQGERFRLAVLEHNAPALAFWQRVGFVPTGELKPYRQHQVVLLQKS
ncbi:hypothetical protein ABS71_16100 [bacterium SCN 62-11]|nr:GNAT family N-acetyltransferase [Candidatus Eremiobacteraeota bacterium]ODT62188.1 MAG: hypothetical protein ABS71_16100 [bacterium SCN 62-11]